MDKLKQALRQMDLFSCLPTLRAKSHPQTANSCGGVLSILVLALFAYLFISQFVDVTNWQKIQFISSQNNDLQNKEAIDDFMVAIGVEGFSLQAAAPFVRFQFRQVTMKGTTFIRARSLLTQPCKMSHWSAVTENLEQAYKTLNLQNKMCLVPGQDVKIEQQSTDEYRILSVSIDSCLKLDQNDQRIYQNCATQQQFNQGNAQWIKASKYFTALTVFVNTGFQPTKKTPRIKYLDAIRSTFTTTRGAQTIAYLSRYTINTDVSIMPFSESVTETGYKLESENSQNFESVIYFQNINVFFMQSPKSIEISFGFTLIHTFSHFSIFILPIDTRIQFIDFQTSSIDRTVGKVDEILSYAGGFFGIIISFLSFFMISFNQYRYELMVAEGAFNYSDDGSKIKEHDFNFLEYLRYSVYDWVKTLFCVQLDWQKCKQVQQTREEANNQLDVTLLFKKIQHFERVVDYLISDKENMCLYLTEPPSIGEAIKTRKVAEYYQKVIQGRSATTVEDIENIQNIFQFAIGIQQQKTSIGLNNSTTKRKLFQEPEKSRQNILEKALQEYKLDDDIFDVNLDEEDQKLEQQIAEAFFRMAEIARRKIQQKIPIKILHRLRKKYESKISQQTMAINLEV